MRTNRLLASQFPSLDLGRPGLRLSTIAELVTENWGTAAPSTFGSRVTPAIQYKNILNQQKGQV